MEFGIDRTLEILSATPGVLESLLSGLSDDWTETGTADSWGPPEILGHLIHCEQADWIPRARIILDQGPDRKFEPLDRLAQFSAAARPLSELISEFASVRAGNVATLRSWGLSGEQLDLQGVHPEFGEVTLRQLLSTWAVHDLTHIRQIATVLAKKYDSAVGPWREYLSILK